MFKWLGRIILLAIAGFIFLGVFSYFYLKAEQPPDDAEYAVQAYHEERDGTKIPTRYYYADKVALKDGNAVLMTYWTYDGKRYKKINDEKAVKPPFSIIRREMPNE